MKLTLNLYNILCVRGPNGCNVRCCLLVYLRGCRCVEISFSIVQKHLGQYTSPHIFTFPLNPPLAKGDLVKEQSSLMGGSV